MEKVYDFLLRCFPKPYRLAWQKYNDEPIQPIVLVSLSDFTLKDGFTINVPKSVQAVFVIIENSEVKGDIHISSKAFYNSCYKDMYATLALNLPSDIFDEDGFWVTLHHYASEAERNKKGYFLYRGVLYTPQSAKLLLKYVDLFKSKNKANKW